MPPPPMNRNVADSNPRGPDVTNLPRTWITPDDYFHNLAMSMPVTEDSTNAISEPRLVLSTVPVNDLRSAIPPNWTSHATDLWHQYPENWTQLDHNSNPLLSMPVLKHPINSAIDTRDVPDGRFAQTGHQGPKPGYVCPRL
ncbi:hypothetical protein PMG11_06862 [Penicillium brasilianum]|uniref:Uncharacterized protein n=1 Tax=Penicillium brasilianum TaxID=104259 RepID=A0A0F7TQU2_PENBI|nr:hypothetical protein PMG11_06862 [Penicillium brasilianum]